MKELPVIIAGAGIAGLAAAIAMARRGREVIVHERRSAFETEGAGLQSSPNAIRALKALGAWDAFAPSTWAPPAILIRDGLSGRLLKRLPLGVEFERRFGEPYRVAHRADLHRALSETALRHASVSVRFSDPIEAYRADDGYVTAISGSGEHPASLLLGADGVRSAVRAQMLGDGPPTPVAGAIFRTLAPMRDLADSECVTLWLCPGGHVVHYPVSGGAHLNLVAAIEQGTPATAFTSCATHLQDVLALAAQWGEWPAAIRRPARRWHEGRVALVGDAAHPTLPYLAQGAAMALEDAAFLGTHGHGELYAARSRRTSRVSETSRKLSRGYHARGLLRLARNTLVGASSASGFLDRLAWIYAA